MYAGRAALRHQQMGTASRFWTPPASGKPLSGFALFLQTTWGEWSTGEAWHVMQGG